MSRYCPHDIQPVLSAAEHWRNACLIEDRSVFSSDPIWTVDGIEELYKYFTQNPDEGDRTFLEKLKDQLEPALPSTRKLAAECLWVLVLFQSGRSMKGTTKREQVREIWSWSGDELPESHPYLTGALESGVGHAGTAYMTRRWAEFQYLIDVCRNIKKQEKNLRGGLFSDPWEFAEWLDGVDKKRARPQFRHILKFLLFPDYFERISTGKHKRQIVGGFRNKELKEVRKLSFLELDREIYKIRKDKEEELSTTQLDFYADPLVRVWKPEAEEGNVQRVWVEKTIVAGRADREEGAHALGKALWSPQRSTDGKDIYRNMREVRAGDVVIHLTDNSAITGMSIAATAVDDSFVGLSGSDWADRPAYRIALRDFVRLDPPLQRDAFLGSPIYRERLQGLIASHKNLFFAKSLELNQGAYLTEAPEDLVHILNEAYRGLSGQPLPLLHLDDMAPVIEQPTVKPNLDLAAITTTFAATLKASHVEFGDQHLAFVRAFIAGLATKPLAILTGLSGSGKTQIAIRFGEWLGGNRLHVAAVRPDWTGAEALFGYEDALKPVIEGKPVWSVPDTLAFMLRAASDLHHPYVLILDEMNLAHVERYFADVLSGMESGQPVLPNLAQDGQGNWRCFDKAAPKLPVPQNLFVIGTVNIDETTYMFSPKVLDRANTFEFRVKTSDLLASYHKPVPCSEGDAGLVRGFLEIATNANWHLENHHSSEVDLIANLCGIHELMSAHGFEFGHRVFFESLRFASLHEAAGNSDLHTILDRIVMQKLLPRVHGSRRRIEALLLALSKVCFEGTGTLTKSEPVVAFDPELHDPRQAALPLGFDKLSRMLRTLRANQFTSFTE